jgi:glycosyltransferase involved in cell wall biosynthesis
MSAVNRKAIDIVIPVYNEGENILSLLAAFERDVSIPIRLLICFDRDDDTTLTAISSFQSRFPIVPVKNRGLYAHGAVVTGFQYSDAPAVISYMADDDYNAGLINQMAERFWDGDDIVCGSRFIPGGCMVGCRAEKAFLVRSVALSLHLLGRLPVHDPTNAFRLISRRLLDKVTIESSQGFTYSLELLAKCHRLKWRISEIPAQWYERSRGASRFNVLGWAPSYLRWYFYVFATTYLRRTGI